MINFQEFTTKEIVLREVWKKSKIPLSNRPIFFDHDYATLTNMRIHWDTGSESIQQRIRCRIEAVEMGFQYGAGE